MVSKRNIRHKESFIELASKLHNDKYDYSHFKYISNKTKGEIICPIHGSFWQTPSVHNRKSRPSGCPQCGNENKRVSFEEFVKRANKIHGDNYVYDKTKYVDTKTPISIFCKRHNQYFAQLPSNHIHINNPTKCPLCSSEIIITKNRDTFSDFLQKARKIHEEKYEYYSDSYVNSTTKINIFCKKCQKWFKQTPHTHLSGKGCPYCRTSHMEESVMNFLDNLCIKYVYQKSFEWLKFKKGQYLDFYLPDYNIAIECQGEQHFKPVDFSHNKNIEKAKNGLIRNQERDKNKFNLCKEHNMPLYYIMYNEDIKEKLFSILIENKII